MKIGMTLCWMVTSSCFLIPLWSQVQTVDVRLSEDVARSTALVAVRPEYPPIGRQLRLAGTVVTEVTVGIDGKVEKVDIISGHPLLVNSVRVALKKWKFPPKEIDGRHVVLHFRMSFVFKL